MAEFVQQDDREQRQVLENVPDDGTVSALASLNLERGDEEPGPVQIDIDSLDAEETDRPWPIGTCC